MFKNLNRIHTKFLTLKLIGGTSKRFAGHSKWQNIRHIKAAKDSQKSLAFLRLSKQMKIAIMEGGTADTDKNVKLEQLVEQARRISMPQATIQNIIKTSQQDKSNSKTYLLEIKGPGGAIILLEVFTAQYHYTKQNIQGILKKHASKYTDGGGIHSFEQKGIIEADISNEIKSKKPDDLLETATDDAIECGAEDVRFLDENTLQFQCGATSLKKVTHELEKKYTILNASVEYIPIKLQELSDDELQVCGNLYEKLENLPEFVRISDNIA